MNLYYVTLDVDGEFRGHHVVAPSYDLASQWAEEWVWKMDEDAVSVVVRVIQRLYTSRSMLPAEGDSRKLGYKYSYIRSKVLRLDLYLHWRLSGIGEQERHP